MKKIFYILPFLFLSIITSCDDEETIVHVTPETSELVVTGISPVKGYQESVVTIAGSGFGVSEELVKLFFGSSTNEAEIISCTDGQLVAKVPQGATSGAITVEVLDKKLTASTVTFTVIPDPEIISLSADKVYSDDEITITGKNFGTVLEDVKLYCNINDEEVLFIVKSCTNEEIVATVPKTEIFGEFDLKLEILGTSSHNQQKITILEKAQITSVKSNSELFSGKFIFAGDQVTIKGVAFGSIPENVSVKIGDSNAKVLSCKENEIIVEVPAGCQGGKVTVTKDGIVSLSTEELKVLANGTDISDGALKNCMNPESEVLTAGQAGTDAQYGIPKSWICTSSVINQLNPGATDRTGAINPSGRYFKLQAGWGGEPEPSDDVTPSNNYIKNGKMYQQTSLPAGNYTLEIDVMDHGHSASEIHFVVSNAGYDFPSYNNISGNESVIASVQDEVYYADVNTPYKVSLDFTLSEKTDVLVGVALNFAPNIWYSFKGFRLIYKSGI